MERILQEGAEQMGFPLTETQRGQLCRYAALLKEWNEKINLTAITDDEGIAVKHFLDSLSAFVTGKVGRRVIDIGTGAGFPGLVLKIAQPQTELTLLDSLNKRINFLKETAEQLELSGITFIHARAEDGARRPELREQFDTAVSRAVANLPLLAELCLPYVRVGGYFLALKGPMADTELAEAKRAISILGGKTSEVVDVSIPFSQLNHKIVVIQKIAKTPVKYPRKPGVIGKVPIPTCYNVQHQQNKW